MSKKKKSRKTKDTQPKTNRIQANWHPPGDDARGGTRALENPIPAARARSVALHDKPTTSPNKFMALFFGIPTAILVAAIAFRVLSGS